MAESTMSKLTRKVWLVAAVTAGLSVWLAGAAMAQQKKAGPQLKVKVGDPAPEFELKAVVLKNGKPTETTVRLSDFKGKKNVVLYFFPKASTPG